MRVIRGLLAGEELAFGDLTARLRDPVPDVRLYMAATGTRNLRLAGQIADGVILLSGVAPAGLERATGLVRAGVAASGRTTEQVPLTVSAYCHVSDDVERDAIRLKPVCAAVAQNGGGEFLRSAGIDIQVPAYVPGVYPDFAHAEDWPAAVRIAGQWVSDADAVRFADAFCLFGSAEDIAARLLEAQRRGAYAVTAFLAGRADDPAFFHMAVPVKAPDVELVADPGLDARYPARWGARVQLFGSDPVSVTVDDARSGPGRAWTTAQRQVKFDRLVRPYWPRPEAADWAAHCARLPKTSDSICDWARQRPVLNGWAPSAPS